MRPTLRLAGRMTLTARQRRIWLTLAGEVPGGSMTVERLLQWVLARKARIAAAAPSDDVTARTAALDALFEWCAGVDMPDPSSDVSQAAPPPASKRALTGHIGGRSNLERELLALIVTGKGDSARAHEVSDLLDRRRSPKVV